MNRFINKMFRTAIRLPAVTLAAAALLLVIYPPPAHAQSIPVKRSDTEKKTENGVIVLEGELVKAGTFFFRDNVVTYKHENRSGYPYKLRIDNKEFKKGKPFELGFMPDFDHAKILEQECGGKTELELIDDELILRLDQRKVRDEGKFRIVLSLVDPDKGVQPVDESPVNREPEKKRLPSKMDMVTTAEKDEASPSEQETDRRILPSKMDLVRIGHEVEELPKYVTDPVTGKRKLSSKMDLLTMKRKRLPNIYRIFKFTRPTPSPYPTKLLVFKKLSIPRIMWTIEDEEYYQDSLRSDKLWIVQPTDEEVRAQRDWENTILLGILRKLKGLPEEPEQ